MSSMPNQRDHAGPPRSGPPGGGGGGAPTLDPIKLLQKYKFVLVIAICLGGVVGVGAHFFFMKFFPKYRSTVLFECSPVQTDISVTGIETIDEDEMARFIGTQVETLKGERVRSEVLADPRLADRKSVV